MTPENEQFWKSFLPGYTSSSGLSINKSDLTTVPTFYSCLNVLANSIAKMPTHIYKENNGLKNRVSSDISYLLDTRPNPNMTPFIFKHTRMVQQVIYGNSYTWVQTVMGKTIALWLLNAKYMKLEKVNGKIYYSYDDGDNQAIYTSEEIIHTKQLSEDGIEGKSILPILLETVGNIKAANQLFGKYFKNGSNTNLVAEYEEPMGSAGRNEMRNDIMEGQTGLDNAHKLMIVAGGGKIKEINGGKFADQQLLESLKLNDEQIARALNVPLAMVGIMSGATFSNTEQQNLNYVTNTLQPLVTQWEEEETYKLYGSYIRQQGYYIKYNMASALRSDDTARANYYKEMISGGIYCIDEVRAKEDMNPLPDGLGAKYRVDLNHVNLEIVDEYQLGKVNSPKGGD